MNTQAQEALKMAIGIAEKAIKHWKNNIDDLDAKQWEKIDKYEDKLYDLKEALDTKQVCENAAPAQDTETMAVAIALQEQIRQLKEQPAQEYDVNELIDKITPENLQEPVAWMYERDNGAAILEFADDLDFHGMKAIPLYTHPVQNGASPLGATTLRTPLSDDEIFKIVSTIEQIKPQYGMMLSNEWNILDFARAIEAAHGIV